MAVLEAVPELVPSTRLMEGFSFQRIKTRGAEINVATAGEGPPLLLIHGNPLTLVSWHKIAPSLARDFSVVAIDMRGYGDSSKPYGGEDHSGYSFRSIGEDAFDVMDALGHKTFAVAGHDRGRASGSACASTSPSASPTTRRSTSCRPTTC